MNISILKTSVEDYKKGIKLKEDTIKKLKADLNINLTTKNTTKKARIWQNTRAREKIENQISKLENDITVAEDKIAQMEQKAKK